MEHVAGTKEFADKLPREGIDLDQLSETLPAELYTILEDLKVEFS